MEIETIKRLHSLRPGQSFAYYRGDIDHDIAHSDGAAYRDILCRVRDASLALEREGKIHIRIGSETRPVKTKKDETKLVRFNVYVAEGR